MKPLQAVAMGLVVIGLVARFGGFDAYADPLGWLLVLAGLRGLLERSAAVPYRSALRWSAGIAAVVSVPLWLPPVVDWLAEADPALEWAAYLPQFVFLALLFHALAATAADAGERGAAGWLRLVVVLAVVVMVAPVVVLGAGVDEFADAAQLSYWAVFVVAVWQLFSYAGRVWAGAPVSEESGESGKPGEAGSSGASGRPGTA